MSGDDFNIPPLPPDPLLEALKGTLRWIEEDYGFVDLFVLEFARAAHQNPSLSLEEILEALRLDWSK